MDNLPIQIIQNKVYIDEDAEAKLLQMQYSPINKQVLHITHYAVSVWSIYNKVHIRFTLQYSIPLMNVFVSLWSNSLSHPVNYFLYT